MANFQRQDITGRARFIVEVGPLAADLDVKVLIPLDDGEIKPVELTRVEIVGGTTAPQRTNTRAFLDALRALAVTKAGGV